MGVQLTLPQRPCLPNSAHLGATGPLWGAPVHTIGFSQLSLTLRGHVSSPFSIRQCGDSQMTPSTPPGLIFRSQASESFWLLYLLAGLFHNCSLCPTSRVSIVLGI